MQYGVDPATFGAHYFKCMICDDLRDITPTTLKASPILTPLFPYLCTYGVILPSSPNTGWLHRIANCHRVTNCKDPVS